MLTLEGNFYSENAGTRVYTFPEPFKELQWKVLFSNSRQHDCLALSISVAVFSP